MPVERLASGTVPALVIDGGESWDWLRKSTQALKNALPDARYRTLKGWQHNVDAGALAPVLVEFFAEKL